MKRRSFLKLLGFAGAAYPAVAAIPQAVSVYPLPQEKLPKQGETRIFVEDVYFDSPLGSHLQSRQLPVNAGARLVEKAWSGKRWIEVRVLDSWVRTRGFY